MFSMRAVRPAAKKTNHDPPWRTLDRGKTSPDLPQRHSQAHELMLPRERDVSVEPGASWDSTFHKINWKRPLCQPCTTLHLCSMPRAWILLPVGPRNQLPHFGEEQEARISYFYFFFLFCATSHDRFCCLTQGFWPGCVLLLLLSGKFKCFGANTVPSSDGCPAKAPHCSCSNMFFWKG